MVRIIEPVEVGQSQLRKILVTVLIAVIVTGANAAMMAYVLMGDGGGEEHLDQADLDERYMSSSGGTLDGDLSLRDVEASGTISGDGSGIFNLNADNISSGTLDPSHLPSGIDATTLGGTNASGFALATHVHPEYFTQSQGDARYALLSHTHSPGDATTLDGIDSTGFAMALHSHDDVYWNKTEMAARYYTDTEVDSLFSPVGHSHAPGDADTLDGHESGDFALTTHIHDERYYAIPEVRDLYYNKTESNVRFALASHTHAPGDATSLDGFDSTDFAMAAHTHDDRYWTKSELATLYYNRTETGLLFASSSHTHAPGDADTLDGLDSTDFADSVHDHNSLYYTEAECDAQYAVTSHTHTNIDATTLDGLDSMAFAMAAHTHDDRYWNKSYINDTYYNRTSCDAMFSLVGHDHDGRYYNKTESDVKYALAAHTHADYWNKSEMAIEFYNRTECDSNFAPNPHDHDGLYYNKTYVDGNYYNQTECDSNFAPNMHDHDDLYYNKTYIDGTYYNQTFIDTDFYNITEANATYANITHIHPPGDADTLDGNDSSAFALVGHTHDETENIGLLPVGAVTSWLKTFGDKGNGAVTANTTYKLVDATATFITDGVKPNMNVERDTPQDLTLFTGIWDLTYVVVKTFTLSDNQSRGLFVNEHGNEIAVQWNGAGWMAFCRVRYYYADGTDNYSSEESCMSATWPPSPEYHAKIYENPHPEKKVWKMEVEMRGTGKEVRCQKNIVGLNTFKAKSTYVLSVDTETELTLMDDIYLGIGENYYIHATPVLPDNFIECNGQNVSDPESPYCGQAVPDLNGEGRFLRGNTASGATGGSETHSHTIPGAASSNPFGAGTGYIVSNSLVTGTADTLPPYYEVVWIMRIK